MIAFMLRHARAEAPREACGVVIDRHGHALACRCRNVHVEPEEHFRLHPADYLEAAAHGKVIAIYHSHPGARPDPTPADRAACNQSGLPWYIVAPERGDWVRIEPNGKPIPLLGRPYVYGALDCYTLVRDYYARELGLELPDFERPADLGERENVFDSHAEAAGFVRVDDLRQHDVVVIAPRGRLPEHCAVYVGDGRILHHHLALLSAHAEYDEDRRARTIGTYRHRSLQ